MSDRNVHVEEVFAEVVASATLLFARRGDAVIARDHLRRSLLSHSRDFAANGIDSAALKAFESLLWSGMSAIVGKADRLLRIMLWVEVRRSASGRPSVSVEPITSDEFHQYFSTNAYVDEAQLSIADERALPSHVKDELHDMFDVAFERVRQWPWVFSAYVRTPIPTEWSSTIGERIELGSFVLQEAEDDEEFDVKDLLHGMGERSAEDLHALLWSHDFFYLARDYVGFVAVEAEPNETITFSLRRKYKSLLGLCIATGLLEHGRNQAWDHAEPIMIFGTAGGAPSQIEARWLSAEEGAVVGSLGAAPVRTDQHRSYLKKMWRWIEAALREDHTRLAHAGRWFFDSLCGTNSLLQLVQATTTLEILLGEPDEIRAKRRSVLGTTELLANRYAYLVGVSSERRAQAEREFREVYDARSRVVHSGRDDVDENVVARARSLCVNVIRRELAIHAEV